MDEQKLFEELSEIKVSVGKLVQHADDQKARCDNHANRLEELEKGVISLNETREYSKGVIKAIGVGAPAIGSLAWLMIKYGEAIKSLFHHK